MCEITARLMLNNIIKIYGDNFQLNRKIIIYYYIQGRDFGKNESTLYKGTYLPNNIYFIFFHG